MLKMLSSLTYRFFVFIVAFAIAFNEHAVFWNTYCHSVPVLVVYLVNPRIGHVQFL